MKKSLISTLIASALVVGHAPLTSAADLNLTHSFVSSVTDVGNGVISLLDVPGSNGYTHTFTAPTTTIPTTSYGFYDDFVFTVDGALTNSVTTTIGFGTVLGINDLHVRLFKLDGNTFPVLGDPVGTTLAESVVSSSGNVTIALLEGAVLGAGTYVLEIRGNVVGSAGGTYSGGLNLAPVPVPASMWMFGSAVLGLAGIARRRK